MRVSTTKLFKHRGSIAASNLTTFRCRLYHDAAENPTRAEVSSSSTITQIVETLRTQGIDSWESNSHLNQLLSSSFSSSTSLSATHFLRIARQLDSCSSALKFVEYLQSKSLRLPTDCLSSAFQAVFELASRTPRPAEKLWSLVEVSKEMGIPLSINAAMLLIKRFGWVKRIERSMTVYEELLPELRNTHVRNALLAALFGCERLLDARKLLDEMLLPDAEFPPNDRTGMVVFESMLKSENGGNSIKEEELVGLVLRLGRHNVFPDSQRLTLLISAMCRHGRSSTAWNLLHSLMKLDGPMAAPPFNALLSAMGRKNEYKKMNLLMKEMMEKGVKPDVVTYGILINHLCKSHRVDDALKLLNKMRLGSGEDGILVKPDVVIYNTIADGLCKLGRWEEGLALMERMRSEDHISPNTATYNCLIDGLCRAGDIQRALDLVEMMNKDEVQANVITMNTLVGGMCRHGRISSALEFFTKMKGKGVEGNQVTYATLISAYCNASNVDKAMELFGEMKHKCKPDAVIYYTLILGLCQSGRMDDASCVMSTLKEAGFLPDIGCYNTMISGFCKKKKLDKAYDLLKQMEVDGIKPDGITHNTLISYFAKSGEFHMVKRLWRKMIKSGIEPTVVTYGTLVHAHCLAGEIDEAMKVFKEMESIRKIQPNTVIYNTLIDYLCKKKDIVLALSLFNEMLTKEKVRPDSNTFNAIFRGLMQMNWLEKAFELMDIMSDLPCDPDYITMDILTTWLSAIGETDRLRRFVLRFQESELVA